MARFFLSHLKRIDLVLLGSCAALTSFSLPSLWALGAGGAVPGAFFWKQFFYLTGGVLVALFVSLFNVRILQKHGSIVLLGYLLSLVLLGGLFLFGEVIHGTKAWYRLGVFSVAPVEFIKVGLLVMLAKFFSDRHRDLYTLRHVVISLCYAGALAVLVLLEPDAGSAIVLLGIWLGVVFFTGIRARWMAALCVLVMLSFGLSWTYGLKPYQKERVMSFLYSQREVRGSGYNVLQAKVAIGSGGLFGKSLGEGSQSSRQFLPASPTDFMFAVIAEERGLFGVLALFMFFCLVWYRSILLGMRARHNFGRIFAFGYTLLLAIHFFVNAGMNLGMFPVIGIPLPFVSYGGSHVLANFLGLGILLAIGKSSYEERAVVLS